MMGSCMSAFVMIFKGIFKKMKPPFLFLLVRVLLIILLLFLIMWMNVYSEYGKGWEMIFLLKKKAPFGHPCH